MRDNASSMEPVPRPLPVLSFDDDGSEDHFCGECDAAGYTVTLVRDIFEYFTCGLCGKCYKENKA